MAAERHPVLEVGRVGVPLLPQALVLAEGVVVIEAQPQVRPGRQRAPPMQADVAAGGLDRVRQGRRRGQGQHPGLAELALVEVAEEGDVVALVGPPVAAEARVPLLPAVARVGPGGVRAAGVGPPVLGIGPRVLVRVAPVEAHVQAVAAEAVAAAELGAGRLVAGRGHHQAAPGVGRVPGHDVDDAVDGVRAPERAAGPAHDLDAVDVLDGQVLHVPVHPGEELGVDDAPVHQHQQLRAEALVEAADGDLPLVGVDAGDLDAGRQAQQLGHQGQARAPDVLAGDHVHGAGAAVPFLGGAAAEGDLHVQELFEFEFGDVAHHGVGGGGTRPVGVDRRRNRQGQPRSQQTPNESPRRSGHRWPPPSAGADPVSHGQCPENTPSAIGFQSFRLRMDSEEGPWCPAIRPAAGPLAVR